LDESKKYKSEEKVTLDGQRYLKYYRPDTNAPRLSPNEFEAIKWLNENLKGQPVIVEAAKDPYSYFSRISTNTGLPAILGWYNHQQVWRKDKEGKIFQILNERNSDIKKIYTSTSIEEAHKILDKYDATYVYLGQLEKETYPGTGLDKFASSGWNTAFTMGGTSIYEVPR